MAQKKAHEVDRYLANPQLSHRIFLIYGPDRGLVSERATKLAKASGTDLTDPFSTIILDVDEAASDPSRIADEAHTVSMFGGNRIVWLKGTTLKNLTNALQPVLDLPPTDAIIIIEAGDLKKSSSLRRRIESTSCAIALPCYQDQTQTLNLIIEEELQAAKLTITAPAKTYLLSQLGGDRLASRAEVKKLCLYAHGHHEITEEAVMTIVGDASALAVETVIDAASTGDIAGMEHMFKRLIAQGTAVFQLINAAQRHFQTLHQARTQMDANRQPASSVIGALRPPVNFKRKDKITRALSLWNRPALERALKRLDKTSLDTRKNSALATSLASTAFLAIAIEAKQQSR